MKNYKLMLTFLTFNKSGVFLLAFLVLLMSCTTDEKQWEEAKRKNTVEGYELFLSKYSESEYSNEAQNSKDKLEEQKLWEEAKRKNTIEGYELFLSKYPESEFAQEALIAKDKLLPNIVFMQIDKSKSKASFGIYGAYDPTTVVANDGTLLGEFTKEGSFLTGLNVYFYIINKGGSGKVSIKFRYSDVFPVEEKVKTVNLLKSKKYKVKVSLYFKGNSSVSLPFADVPMIKNNLEIILPNKTKDKFSVSIISYNGQIKNIEFIEVN